MDFLRDLGRVSLLSDNFCVLASLLEGTSWWMIHMIVTFFIVFQCISYYIYNYMFFQCCFSCFNAQRWNNSRCISSLVVHQKKTMIPTPKSIVSCCFFFAALAGASIFINDGPIELAESSKVQAAPVLWRSCWKRPCWGPRPGICAYETWPRYVAPKLVP